MQMILSIALGGAMGAVARHFLSYRIASLFGHGLPYGTLAVNVLGSFFMGVLITLFAERYALSQEMRAFLTVGLLGGFTTFSTFSLETALLIERNALGLAALYIAASVLLAVGGLFAGIWAGRAAL
jgi:fluoride exporter